MKNLFSVLWTMILFNGNYGGWMNQSVGIDGISAKPLKLAREHIITSIRHLINQSFNEGEFINEWKSAKVIPFHKKGDVNDVKNYRPISILSTSSKIIERITLFRQLYDYLVKHAVLNKAQFGFRPGRDLFFRNQARPEIN